VEQTVVLNKTRRFLLSIVVRIPPQEHQPGMMVYLPLGLYLPAGVITQLDSRAPVKFELQTCDYKGCYAGSAVSPEVLAAMKKGTRLTITFQDLRKDKITVRVPLEGFAEAYHKIE
jgi:invasion protein IalB